jgi:hypothetical protein
MKKKKVFGITIFSIFILLTLIYQPIIAEKSIFKEEFFLVKEFNINENSEKNKPMLLCILLAIITQNIGKLIYYYDYFDIEILANLFRLLQSPFVNLYSEHCTECK